MAQTFHYRALRTRSLGIAHLRHGIVGAFGAGDRVGHLRRLDVLQELERQRREIWIVDRRGDLDPCHAAFAVDRAFQRRDGAHLRIASQPSPNQAWRTVHRAVLLPLAAQTLESAARTISFGIGRNASVVSPIPVGP